MRNLLCLGLALFVLPACAQRPGPKVSQNPGIVQIEASGLAKFDKVCAISDVHGMYRNGAALLQGGGLIDARNNWTGGKTLLVVTGDSIDKGPQSLEVLALWMRLMAQAPKSGGRVIVLLGNHEAELLADPINDRKTDATKAELPAGVSIVALTDSTSDQPVAGVPLKNYAAFLRSLPAAARLGDWLFCHAGWVPVPLPVGTPVTRWKALVAREDAALNAPGAYSTFLQADGLEFLERKDYPDGTKWSKNPDAERELERRLDGYGLKGVVFGHVPAAFGITDGIGYFSGSDHRLIKIDSGMAPEAGGFAGHLLVLPDPRELYGAAPIQALSGTMANGRFQTGPLTAGQR